VRFLVDGAALPADADAYQRIVLIFNGDDDDAVAAARVHWTDAKAKGFEATYWQPDDNGRWVKKA
jgi:DNA polymerase-3 subunit chi